MYSRDGLTFLLTSFRLPMTILTPSVMGRSMQAFHFHTLSILQWIATQQMKKVRFPHFFGMKKINFCLSSHTGKGRQSNDCSHCNFWNFPVDWYHCWHYLEHHASRHCPRLTSKGKKIHFFSIAKYQTLPFQIFQGFSVYSNSLKLFNTDNNHPDNLNCINGIRYAN